MKSSVSAVGVNVQHLKFSVLVHALAFLTDYVGERLLAQQKLHSITHLRVLDVIASVESITTASMITILVVTALKTKSFQIHLAFTPTVFAHITPSTTETFYRELLDKALT